MHGRKTRLDDGWEAPMSGSRTVQPRLTPPAYIPPAIHHISQDMSTIEHKHLRMYTDGSLTLSPAHAHMAFWDRRREKGEKGKASAAIIIRESPSGPSAASRTSTPSPLQAGPSGDRTIAIHIDKIEEIPACIPFTAELIAAIIALSILPNGATGNVWSDCKAVCDRYHGMRKGHSLSVGSSHGPLLRRLRHLSTHNISFTHIPAHPERRSADSADWSEHEVGNFVADAVAGGKFSEVDRFYSNCTVHTISFPDIASMLVSPDDWTIYAPPLVHANHSHAPHTPMWTQSLLQIFQEEFNTERFTRYLERRSDLSTRDGVECRWEELTWQLYNLCQPHFSTLRVQMLRMALGQMPVGENLRQWGVPNVNITCPLCEQHDHASHFMYCAHTSVQHILTTMFTSIDTLAADNAEDETVHRFITLVSHELRQFVATHTTPPPNHIPSRSKPLLALWAPTQIQSIVHSLPHPTSMLPAVAITKLRSALVRIHKITSKSALATWRARRSRSGPPQRASIRNGASSASTLPTAITLTSHTHHHSPASLNLRTSRTCTSHAPMHTLSIPDPRQSMLSPTSSPISSISSEASEMNDEEEEDAPPIHDTIHATGIG